MAAIRFFSEFTSIGSDDYTVEIWDKEYTGEPFEFKLGPDGFRIGFSESESAEAKILMGTQCSFLFYMQNTDHEAMIADFATSAEGRFLVRILKDDALYWCGVVLLDISSYDEAYYPYGFNIKAVDGLGSLEKVPFRDADNELYAGKALMIEFITRALSKIQHVGIFYDVGEPLVRSAMDWWEETMDVDAAGVDMLGQTYIDNAVYYKYEKTGVGVMSCQEVIVDILKPAAARITFFNGAFWIEQIEYRRALIIVQRNWDKEGSFIESENYNAQNTINQTAAGALLAVAEYEWLAPVSEVRHFAAKQRRNLFAGATNVDQTHTGIDTFKTPINYNDGATTLRIAGALVLRISSNISVPAYAAPLAPFVVIIRINLFLKTVGLLRDYNLLPSYQFTYDIPVWDNPPAFYILQPIGDAFLGNVDDAVYTYAQQIDFITPPLTENTDQFTFSCSLEAIKKYDGTAMSLSDFDIQYDISNLWMEVFSNGGPLSNGEGLSFLTENPDTNNTVVLESESLIGSSLNPNTLGALWVKPGADYQLAANWAVGENDFTFPFIGQLMTSSLAGMREFPTKILSGELYGNIRALARVIWDDLNWILIGGEWTAASNTLSGRWLEIKETEGLPPSDPIPFMLYPDPNPPSTVTDVPGGTGPFRVSAPLGTILYPVASTLSNEDIRPGAITSLDIQHTLSDYDFNTGDTLVIVNPFSGGFEELSVTALTLDGQTSISVSGTLLNNYPVGSPIVRLPRIGAGYSLPGGPNGAIFKRVGGKWVAYSGATAGHVLTWDITTGATFQALPAGYTDEQAQDAVGAILTDSVEIDFTYNDGAPSITAVLIATGVTPGSYNLVTVDSKGRITSASVAAYLTANQTITLSGDVTGSGTVSIAVTIAAGAVTLAKMANMATASFLGRNTGGTGSPEVLSIATAKTMLGLTGTNSGDQTITLTGDVTGSGTGSFAATIANDAVTYAKMQNVSAVNRFLGRKTAGAGDVEELTVAEVLTILSALSGTGVNKQVVFFTAAQTVDGDVSFLYDVAAFRLQVNGSGSVITPTARLDVRMNVVSGTDELFRYRGQVSDTVSGIIENTRNISGTGNAGYVAQVGGTSAGNPFMLFIIPGGKTFVIGVDNSDADKLKIRAQASVDVGATGGEGLTMTGDVTPLVGINTDTPVHPLDVNGRARALTWTNRTEATPATHTFGTGAGTGPSLSSVSYATGNTAQIRFTTGTSPTADGVIVTIVPPASVRHANKIYGIPGAGNKAAANELTKFYVDTATSTPAALVVKANGSLTASTEYMITFLIMGHA